MSPRRDPSATTDRSARVRGAFRAPTARDCDARVLSLRDQRPGQHRPERSRPRPRRRGTRRPARLHRPGHRRNDHGVRDSAGRRRRLALRRAAPAAGAGGGPRTKSSLSTGKRHISSYSSSASLSWPSTWHGCGRSLTASPPTWTNSPSAWRAGDPDAAAVVPDRRAERRRRVAEPDLEFRAFCARRGLPASSTLHLERAWDAWQAERYRRGETLPAARLHRQPVPATLTTTRATAHTRAVQETGRRSGADGSVVTGTPGPGQR